jgi:hypothetical protein
LLLDSAERECIGPYLDGVDVKRISAVGAKFKHAPVEADVGIVGRRFKIEIVPECQLNTAAFKKRE